MKFEIGEKWNESRFGKMTFENICRLYSSDKSLIFSEEPPIVRAFYAINGKNKYAIRWNRYEVCADFTGESRGCDYFILNGKCKININGIIRKSQKGKYFEFPKGKYKFEVIGDEVFEYVAVYKLPDDSDFPEIEINGDAFR